LAGKSIKYVSP
jgi:hypothetical protein